MKISGRARAAGVATAPMLVRAQRRPAPPKLAVVCTTYFKYSRSQHIVDRVLTGGAVTDFTFTARVGGAGQLSQHART